MAVKERPDQRAIQGFIWKHAAAPLEGENSVYIRMRTGGARKNSEGSYRRTIAGPGAPDGKAITEDDAKRYAAEVVDRHARSGEGGWLEVMRSPGTCLDCLPLGKGGPDDGEPGSAGDEPAEGQSKGDWLVGKAMDTLGGMIRVQSDQLIDYRQEYNALVLRHADTCAKAAGYEAQIKWRDEHGDGKDSEMVAALIALAPTLEAVAPGIAAKVMAWGDSAMGTGPAPKGKGGKAKAAEAPHDATRPGEKTLPGIDEQIEQLLLALDRILTEDAKLRADGMKPGPMKRHLVNFDNVAEDVNPASPWRGFAQLQERIKGALS